MQLKIERKMEAFVNFFKMYRLINKLYTLVFH